MHYRPEGWEKTKKNRCVHIQGIPNAGIKPSTCRTCPTNIKECQVDFEAGADAMLEALKKKTDTQYGELDSDIHANDFYFEIYTIGEQKLGEKIFDSEDNEKGWLVFIPEEEEE